MSDQKAILTRLERLERLAQRTGDSPSGPLWSPEATEIPTILHTLAAAGALPQVVQARGISPEAFLELVAEECPAVYAEARASLSTAS